MCSGVWGGDLEALGPLGFPVCAAVVLLCFVLCWVLLGRLAIALHAIAYCI